MGKLDDLIKELCPNGVKYFKLNEVCSINTGTQLNKSKLLEMAEYPVINGGINPSGYWHEFNTEKDTITISQGGASAGYVNYMDVPFWAGAHCYVVKKESDKINYRFLYHFLKSKEKILQQCQQGAGIPGLSRKAVYELLAPVPPLEVQCEIVHVLDDFTLLSAELSAELKAREKQYEYYSSELFKQTNAKEYSMEELAEFVYGYTDKAKDTGDARFVRITDINEQGYLKNEDIKYITLNEEAKKYILQKGDLVMARTGATYGKTLYFDSNNTSVYASFLIKINLDNTKMINKYYWHYTKTPLYWEQAKKLVTTGGQPQFNTPALKKIKIPVPTLEEQEKIVNILDRLDRLCSDVSDGLPAEIDAREKQYEYYRDKLLSFKELKVEE